MGVKIDFNTTTGRIKPMHGVGQPPFCAGDFSMLSYLQEAGIPYCRLHDVGGWLGGGLYVDIPNLFRDFSADENDPQAYDFAFTDRLMEKIIEVGCEPFFRLGVTIENSHMLKTYRLYPPADPCKWARICEHVVRHYNKGWADGYRYNILYWEIWNEPDDCYTTETSAMWKGTPEQYYELYDITSRHLKGVFGDKIKVGGYGHCGFYACDNYPDLSNIGRQPNDFYEFFFKFADGFFRYIKEHSSPLDFFSWHTYADIETALKHADVCRSILDNYGFTKTEDILNEWNTCFDREKRSSTSAASLALGMMLGMQKKSTSVLCYYDARIGASGYGGMFNPDKWKPYPTYYAFKSFNELYKLENEVLSICDVKGVYVGAACNGTDSAALISNTNNTSVECSFDVNADYVINSIRIIDAEHIYTSAKPKIENGTISLPAESCVEITYIKR